MLKRYLQRFPYAAALGAGTALSLGSLLLRLWRTGHPRFVFLSWNLFLAAVPYLLSLALHSRWRRGGKLDGAGFLLACAWLLFFPNAPYVLTDFVHLRVEDNKLWWFDLFMLSAWASTAWLFGLVSLRRLHDVAARTLGPRAAWAGLALVCWLTGVGVYLGRFLRFNSWDLVSEPLPLARALTERLAHPLARPVPHLFALFFALLLGVSYLAFAYAEERAARGLHGPLASAAVGRKKRSRNTRAKGIRPRVRVSSRASS